MGIQSVEKEFFDRLAEVEKAPKRSKTSSSAYKGTVELVLRPKSKCLAAQGFSVNIKSVLSYYPLHHNSTTPIVDTSILTVWGFIDTLNAHKENLVGITINTAASDAGRILRLFGPFPAGSPRCGRGWSCARRWSGPWRRSGKHGCLDPGSGGCRSTAPLGRG